MIKSRNDLETFCATYNGVMNDDDGDSSRGDDVCLLLCNTSLEKADDSE